MEQPPPKRKGNFVDNPSRKMAKTTAGGAGGKNMSFAERMMAKMGHQTGEGLGKGGEGMLNPIEVKLRPQGVGLGAVKEKTEQAKQEARRQAQLRGEELEDSSDEERKARRKRKQQSASATPGGSGTSTPRSFRPKIRYQTAADIEKAVDGLHVPNVLKSLIDATGQQTKLLTSTAGLMSSGGDLSKEEIEAEKLAKRARKELESFADSWNSLHERKQLTDLEEEQVKQHVNDRETELQQVRNLVAAVESLAKLDLAHTTGNEEEQWQHVTAELENLQSKHSGKLEEDALAEVAVATIQPLFKKAMLDWSPLDEPTRLVPYIERLESILGVHPRRGATNDEYELQRRTTSPYESLIYTLWLPKVRSAITNEWDVYTPQPLISVIEAWKPLLPDFVAYSVINNLVVQKLSATLQSWNARTALKSKKRSSARFPHSWLFPWLPYLSYHHTDPSHGHGLLADVNRKLRVALDSWDISQGAVPGITDWAPLMGQTLQHTLVRHMLPRLAAYMASEFEINPADQDITPLEHVLAWTEVFPLRTMGQLLVSEFFPKWLHILHVWLTSDDPKYEEIVEWYSWWKSQIPDNINTLQGVVDKWNEGEWMIEQAVDLGAEGKADLPAPAAGPARPIADPKHNITVASSNAVPNKPVLEEQSLKDDVETWCEEQSLLLMPLREAHPATGLPLFRITASATGKGGVKIYFKGDVLWAQKKGEKDKWEPLYPGDKLMQRAEGR
jgi:tuftelin-interacting protein 11